MFCASTKGPIDVADLQAWLGPLPTFPAKLGDQALFTLDEHEVKQHHRGGFGAAVKGQHPDDITYRQLAHIRETIRGQCDIYAGVLFIHKTPDD